MMGFSLSCRAGFCKRAKVCDENVTVRRFFLVFRHNHLVKSAEIRKKVKFSVGFNVYKDRDIFKAAGTAV